LVPSDDPTIWPWLLMPMALLEGAARGAEADHHTVVEQKGVWG